MHKDIYDDLQQNKISGMKKKVDLANTLIEYKTSQAPKAYVIKNNFETEATPADFIKEDIVCPICRDKYNETIHIKAREENWINKCSKCGTAVEFFTPQPLQKVILDINSSIVNIISGFGLGKTTINMYNVNLIAQMLDGADILVAASTDTALNTGKDELSKFIYKADIMQKGGDLKKKNKELWEYKNGSTVRWMSANTADITKIRSWNLDFAVLLEASSPKFYKKVDGSSFFGELKMRMRAKTSSIRAIDKSGNPVTMVDASGRLGAIDYDINLHKIVLESNPSPTEIMEEVFDKSSTLIVTENVANADKMVEAFEKGYTSINAESEIVTLLASTRDNSILPESYFKSKFGGMPEAYVARMMNCDLTRNEMQVYPEALDYVVDKLATVDILTADRIFQAFDPGSTDPSAFLYAAVWKDYENTGIPKIHLFAEGKTKGGVERKGNSFDELIQLQTQIELAEGLTKFNPQTGVFEQGWENPRTKRREQIYRIADLQLWNKSRGVTALHDQEMETEKDRWDQFGFDYNRAMKGPGSIEMGINLVADFFENGILDWASHLENLREEFIRYWYITNTKGKLEPMGDSWNHLMDGLRYLAFAIEEFLGGSTPYALVNKPKANDPFAGMPEWLRPTLTTQQKSKSRQLGKKSRKLR